MTVLIGKAKEKGTPAGKGYNDTALGRRQIAQHARWKGKLDINQVNICRSPFLFPPWLPDRKKLETIHTLCALFTTDDWLCLPKEILDARFGRGAYEEVV